MSGALEARERADGIKVIVAEEVKTADQGEVIGLFIEEKIPRGMTLQETIAEIRRQGGLVYVPHPFDRMHAVPDYEHLLDVVEDIDAIEVFNPRVAFSAFNEEAARFAAKYRIVAGAGPTPRRAGARLGEDQDARLRRAGGVPRVAARRRHHPQEAVAPVRAGAQVHPDARQEVMRKRSEARDPSNPSDQVPATDDEIREKYLERAIRELNQLTREIQDCEHCPRGNLMPVLGSGHPQADIFLLKFAPLPSEIEEGVAFYGRAGSALMKSFKRLGIDPLAVYGTVFVKCPVDDTDLSAPECRARVLDEIAIVQPRIVVVMGEEALEELNVLRRAARARVDAEAGRDPAPHADLRRPLRAGHRPLARRRRAPSASSGARSARSATGTRTSRRTEAEPAIRSAIADARLAMAERRRSSSWPTGRPSPPSCSTRSERAVQGPCEFTLLVPATPHGIAWAADMHAGATRPRTTAARPRRAARRGARRGRREAGRPRPAGRGPGRVQFHEYDELIVSTLPLHVSKWLHLDLPRKAEAATGLPVTHVVGSAT